MLVYCWLKRSIPGLLLLVVIACSGGLLKPLLVTPSSGRRGNKPFAHVATDALATPTLAANSADIANRPERMNGNHAAPAKVDDWVRTRTGWEHEAKWFATVGHYEPALHPAVVAALVSLVALWALVAFPADSAKVTDEPDGPSMTES